jgi:hypothetical protein
MDEKELKLIKLLAETEGSYWWGGEVKMADSKNEAKRLIDSKSVFFGDEKSPWDTWKPIKVIPETEGIIRIGKNPNNLRFLRIKHEKVQFKEISWLEYHLKVLYEKSISLFKRRRIWKTLS